MPRRWLSDGLVARCVLGALAALQSDSQGRGALWAVHIFSEGLSPAEFGPIGKLPHVHFHLNEPLAETFHHLVHGDALVMAASTLSDVAAWLSAGRGGRIFAHPAASGLLQYVHRDFKIETCV